MRCPKFGAGKSGHLAGSPKIILLALILSDSVIIRTESRNPKYRLNIYSLKGNYYNAGFLSCYYKY
jgi:hypothetical protein